MSPAAQTPRPASPVRKAVILARGLGTRMRAAQDGVGLSDSQDRAAAAGTKGLIDVGRPFMDYSLAALADAGITEVCLVIGPEHQAFRDYYDGLETRRVRISYAVQAEPRGTADAVAAARDFAGADRCVVINSDNYYPPRALRALVAQPGQAVVGFQRGALVAESNIPPERIAAFAVMQVRDGNLVDIVEKPSAEVLRRLGDAPVSMNCWLFTPEIFAACERVQPSPRGELELVDAVRDLAQRGPFPVVPAACGVLDLSSRRDIPAVARALAGVEVNL